VVGAVHESETDPDASGVAVGAAGASGDQARISAVVADGPLPADVTAATLMKRIDPSKVESVKTVDVSFALGVATCVQLTPSALVRME
jgi:hypothetical protein